MSDERTRELIQAELDGVLDEAGRVELDQALGGSAEARKFREDMQRLVHTLEALPQEEPPADLHGRIVRQIALPRRSRWREWFGPLNAAAALRYGVAGATGAALALGVLGSRDELPGVSDYSQMVGTIAPSIGEPAAGPVDRFSVTGEAARAEGALSRTDQGWLLQLDVDGDGPLDLAISFEGTGLSLDGIVRQDGGLDGLDWTGDRLQGRIDGSERLTLMLSGGGGEQRIDVSLSGRGLPVVRAQLNTRGS